MNVLFCDNHLLIAIKPAGISTQEGFDLLVKQWVKEKYQKPGAVFLEPLHRLDKPVSGLVLFARTSKALSRLQEQMRAKQYVKKYKALVEGFPPHQSGTLKHHLVHGEHRAHVATARDPDAKEAELDYSVLKKAGGKSLLDITLKTGRYHQIRIQLAAMGCPVVGDLKYGAKRGYQKDGIALHHYRLSFSHPITREQLTFTHDYEF